jgi:purine-nucleoside phosphorylase
MNLHKKTEYQIRVDESRNFLKSWYPYKEKPVAAIVLGSGLSDLFQKENTVDISYQQIPGFFDTSVQSHTGELSILTHPTKPMHMALLKGRIHGYESYNPAEVVHMIRTLISFGTQHIILTNASGCLREEWQVGETMLIEDQINMTGQNPIWGVFGEGFGPQFQDMTHIYDSQWIQYLEQKAQEKKHDLRKGVYLGVSGPNYETPAEVKMFQKLGGDAIGMSTIWEAMAAHHMGAKVLGVSCLTNHGPGLLKAAGTSHKEVTQRALQFKPFLSDFLIPNLWNYFLQ